jgi:hypothetical protein
MALKLNYQWPMVAISSALSLEALVMSASRPVAAIVCAARLTEKGHRMVKQVIGGLLE